MIKGYYFITDAGLSKNGNLSDVKNAIDAGVTIIQYRSKMGKTDSVLEEAKALKHINIQGLMTMAPFAENPEITRPIFRKLKELADAHSLKELSMGMTQDFEVAIEEGATMVRVGRAIFGKG